MYSLIRKIRKIYKNRKSKIKLELVVFRQFFSMKIRVAKRQIYLPIFWNLIREIMKDPEQVNQKDQEILLQRAHQETFQKQQLQHLVELWWVCLLQLNISIREDELNLKLQIIQLNIINWIKTMLINLKKIFITNMTILHKTKIWLDYQKDNLN